jgi:hypothetical protein
MQGLACLLIDLQEVFLAAIPGRDVLQRRCQFIAESCELLGIPLFFSEQVPEKLGGTIPDIRGIALEAPSYSKRTFSAWSIEALKHELRTQEISHLLIGGIETPICVYQTVVEAVRDDFQVTLLSDAIACRRPQDAPPVLETLRHHEVVVLPSESVFYSILGSVDHPAFKPYTQLVKRYQ